MRAFQKTALRVCLRMAAARNGNPAEVGQLLANSQAFDDYCNHRFAKAYAADSGGKLFLAATSPTALPPGWFLNILNWVMTNFPAILADIIAILHLFPHLPHMAMKAGFSWGDAIHVLGEILPSFGQIAADAIAGVTPTALITKYGQQEVELFQHIVGEFTHA